MLTVCVQDNSVSLSVRRARLSSVPLQPVSSVIPQSQQSTENAMTVSELTIAKQATLIPKSAHPLVFLDTKPARVEKEDLRKLRIVFETVQEDPKNAGQPLSGRTITKTYYHKVDFANHAQVLDLNAWRTKTINQALNNRGKYSKSWLQSEKDFLLELITEQAEKSHPKFPWNRVTNQYNHRLAGVLQGPEERFVLQGNRSSATLDGTRLAPWRGAHAIEQQVKMWPESRLILGLDEKQPIQSTPSGNSPLRSKRPHTEQGLEKESVLDGVEERRSNITGLARHAKPDA